MTSVVRISPQRKRLRWGENWNRRRRSPSTQWALLAPEKNNLRAKVFVRDVAAEYLEPFEFGGER